MGMSKVSAKNVCWKCRLCFHHKQGGSCPKCAGDMFEVGGYFRAPKKAAVRRLALLESAWRAGHCFGRDKGPLPASKAECKAFEAHKENERRGWRESFLEKKGVEGKRGKRPARIGNPVWSSRSGA